MNPSEPSPATQGRRTSGFGWKSILTGIAGALAIAWANSFNTNFLHGPDLIGNHLPVGPLAILMALGVLWNPTVGRLAARLRFAPRELVVALVVMSMCCCVPASGLFRYFHRMIALPVVQEAGKPNWQREGTLAKVPERLFPLLRDAERFSLVAALELEPPDDPAVREVLFHIDTAVLVPAPLAADTAARALEETRQRVAAIGASPDGRKLVNGLVALVPAEDDRSPYAESFRAVRERYQALLPSARREYERVYGGFVQGLAIGDKAVPFSELPWKPWISAMTAWAPMILLMMVCVISLSLVVHRQWSRHEQLSYPLATVATALVERSEGRLLPTILGDRLFWWGFLPILGIHLMNYLAVWFPHHVPRLEFGWGFSGELRALFPVLDNVGDPFVSWGRIYFILVAIAYFISTEMALGIGLSSIALLLVSVQVFQATGGGTDMSSARGGAYFAYAALILYTGRSYYLSVLRKAFTVRRAAAEDREPVWSARIFLAGFAGFVAVLAGPFGVDWFVALLFAATVLVLFLVLTRIVCETGLPFIQANWYPSTFLASTLGIGALGSVPLVMICYLTPIIAEDPREALMPYVANGLKLAENTGVRPFPLAWLGFGAIAIALVTCFISWTVGIYNDGSYSDNYAVVVPSIHLDAASRGLAQLADTGQMAQADATHGIAKLGQVSFLGNGQALSWAAFGAIAVIACSFCRFSFTWWPIHPVLFLVWGTYPANCGWPSFLLGWAIKMLVVRFAGGKIYNQLKPLFIGIIIGEIFAIAMVIVSGFAYYSATGTLPKTYSVMPG